VDIEQYIASGILETYVMGELPEGERRKVEEMAAQYPEVQQELRLIESTLEGLAFRTAIKPASHVKAQLMGRIEGTTATSPKKVERHTEPIVKEHPATAAWMKYAMAACVALLVFTSFTSIYFWNQWKSTEQELGQIIAQNQVIAEQFNQVNNQYNQAIQSLEIASDTAFAKVNMQGLEIARQAYAVVYWDNNSEDVYLNSSGLPPPPTDKQYQLWAIVDGKPVNAGVFDITTGTALTKMQNIRNASAFAVTLEPKGGSESPTLEAMYVMGQV
jgi:anti-sigma-K factor RskA